MFEAQWTEIGDGEDIVVAYWNHRTRSVDAFGSETARTVCAA